MLSIAKQVARWGVLLGVAGLCCAPVHADCLLSLCVLTVSLQSDASGLALGGSGSTAATMAFTTMRAFGGTVPTGVTRTVGATNWTVSTPFDVKVTCGNLITLLSCTAGNSSSYRFTAQLQSADSINTWTIGSATLSNASAATVATTGVYSAVVAYTLSLTIPFSEAAGTISNTVNFVFTAN